MKEVLNFLTHLLVSKQDASYQLDVPVLIAVVGVLIAALAVCVLITKKNHLYIKDKKKERGLESKSEVA